MTLALRERLNLAFLVVGCALHWFVARFSVLWNRDPALWVFGARSGTDFADNAKYLFLHVAEHHPEVRPVWLSKNRDVVSELRARGYEAHFMYSPRGLRCNLRAGVVLFTHGLRDVNLWCSGGARAVLLWHGTPLKHISWDSHFPEESLPVRLAHAYAHRVLDLLTVTAEEMVPVFASALRVDPTTIAVTGYPRNDALFESIPGADIGTHRATHWMVEDLSADHEVLLYLPTFRDSPGGALDTVDLPTLDAVLEKRDAYLLVKTHPDDPLEPGTVATNRIRPLPATADAHRLLSHADALITDYSSIYLDYLLLDRPVVFYAHDLDRYRAERGFYFDYESVTPGPVARTAEELLDAIERTLETDEFADERARVRERFCHTGQYRSQAVYEAVCDLL